MDSMKYIQKETTQPFKKNIWGSVGDFFLTDSDWKLSNNATLQNSPFINPLMFSYSKTTGIAYWARFEIQHHIPKQPIPSTSGHA